MARFFLVFAHASVLALSGCSSGSGTGAGMGGTAGSGAGGNSGSAGTSGSGGTAGSAGNAVGGSAGVGGSGGSAGGLPGTWSVVENDWLYGTKAVAGHPSEPGTIALLIDQLPSQPGQPNTVSVALSSDSGKTLELATVFDIPDTSYFDAHGFVWNPNDAAQIAGAIGFPYGFDFEDLWRLIRSENGGQSFTPTSMLQLDRLKWVPGNPGALVARAEGTLQRSLDFGQSFLPETSPSACTGVIDYTETPSHRLFACGSDGVQRCQGSDCQAATLPSGATSVGGIERAPANEANVIALASTTVSEPAQLLLSTDGGQSFALVQALPSGNWSLHVDPRASGPVIVAHDRIGHGVWRSADSGATFSDVTPSFSLPNTRGLSTYAYELAVTADGGIAAYTAAGVLRFFP